MQARVGRFVMVVVGVLLVAVAVTALVAPRRPFTIYDQPVVIGVTAVFLLVGLLWRPPSWLRRVLRASWVPWVVALLGGWLGVVVGTSMRFTYSWDVGVAFRLARILRTDSQLTEGQVAYLSRYPNTHPLVSVHRAAYAIADATGWDVQTVLGSLGGIAAGLTILLIHPLVARVAGRVRAVAAQLVVVALVATSPWTAVPYTDLLAMPLLTGAVVLVLRAAHRRDRLGLAQLLASAALAAGAIVLKTTPAVLVVAVAVVGLLLAVDLRATRRDALVALGGTVVWGVVTLALVASMSASATAALGSTANDRMRTDATPPTLWWVANGMTPTKSPGNPTRYGGYNGVMLRAISAMDTEEATAWSREWIRTQLVSRDAGDLALFYANKAAWNWGDGMFWAWGEGKDSEPDKLEPAHGIGRLVQAVDGLHGRWYPLRADLAQGLWVALLLVTGVGALRARAPSRDVLLLGLTVLGIGAFTLVFQGRSRYLLTFVPLVVALGAMVRQRPLRLLGRLGRGGPVSRSTESGPAPT
ncbi:MAG TPA: hypothetical protein VFL10_13660 [Ornithinibacter sp.]|nr:hypothetical protein [Ornithinibacter sp.]